ncbi:MAG: winged helix-turn-helix domain-containing protein [Thermoplasmata archaeon]|nr:winged helix-turn-helix domain-containing protein [Thermoplasmata archaeon]
MLSPGFRSLMWYLLCGTRGGPNRLRILELLEASPANAHQIASSLDLDYRTVRHHLRLLERNGAVARPVGEAYASPYELSPYLAEHLLELREILKPHGHPSAGSQRRARPLTVARGAS